ncbi:MAG TPA: glycosyltransferase [Kiloniellales bacterium]|nr:glycosyltransferase [Kiloniellales bacterium]
MSWGESWLIALAALPALAWLYLLLAHGRFWLADQRLPQAGPRLANPPSVVALVPARNEAAVVGEAIASLLAQDYHGRVDVVLVDDGSTDGTADRARQAAAASAQADRLTVLSAPPREPGWVGKLWAVESGRRAWATSHAPPAYWWLTDADIGHAPEMLGRLVNKAEEERRALVSLMVLLWCRSLWERLLIPPFVFFFQKLYPFPRVNDDRSRLAAAAGGCMLVRADTLAHAGGLARIKDALIDDCALAAAIKPAARQESRGLWVGVTRKSRSLRPYRGLGEVWVMVARSAFTQLRHSSLLLLGTLLGMALLYLVPPVVVVLSPWHGDLVAALVALAAWLMMAVAIGPTERLYGQSWLWGLTLPLAGLLYSLMTFDSARRHWLGRGGTWKGRVGAGKLAP